MEELNEGALRQRLVDALAVATRETSGGRLALAFDGDGTLWSGDVGEDFFHAVVGHGDLRAPAVDAMRRVAEASGLAGIAHHDSGVAVARGVFQGYLDHKVDEELICELIAWACAGWTRDDVNAFASELVVRGELQARRRRELVGIVDWARGEGLELFLVSASPRPIVEAAGTLLGFDAAHVIAATARYSADGVMLPEAVRPIPYGPGKATLLKETLGDRTLLAAFGDNIFDVPMLEMAKVPVIIEPKPRLTEHLVRGGGSFRAPLVRLLIG